ncbi:hypothetical protein [Ramlibacter sp. PS4R-6]|uniref:hypothetical protein n=1 Tax=Ramlibacter sp. PS4R-6 TaxID=3133438 RepID=UPI00309EF8A8
MFKKLGAAALISLAVASQAQAGEVEAYSGITADAVSTGLALSAPGIGELNPLGWATVPLRIMMVQHAKSLPQEEGRPMMQSIEAGGWGAAANNLLVLAGASSIAAPIVGLAVGYAIWKKGEPEREFWAICTAQKKVHPQLKCDIDSGKAVVAQAAATPETGAN